MLALFQLFDAEERPLAIGLIIAIGVFGGAACLFLILTFLQRGKRLRTAKVKQSFQELADEILFGLLFGDISAGLAAEKFKQKGGSNPLFQRIMIKSILELHRNYAGDYRKQLELFFDAAGLADLTLKKLERGNEEDIVEAIRDLGALNCERAFQPLVNLLRHPSEWVSKEAFAGIISLEGAQMLLPLKPFPAFLDDWTQSNILFSLQVKEGAPPENLNALLDSPNPSVALLAARMMEYYRQTQWTGAIADSALRIQESGIRQKMLGIVDRLTEIPT